MCVRAASCLLAVHEQQRHDEHTGTMGGGGARAPRERGVVREEARTEEDTLNECSVDAMEQVIIKSTRMNSRVRVETSRRPRLERKPRRKRCAKTPGQDGTFLSRASMPIKYCLLWL